MATYTPEQLERRNNSKWTLVQAVLAPLQFLMFIISFSLVVRYLFTGEGYVLANVTVLIKISLLWLITITGMIWEKEIFGHWFLAPQFFWEDVGNAVAMLTHNLYFLAQWLGWSERSVMLLMVVAYSTYMVNCGQFIMKGLQARKQRQETEALQPATMTQSK
ncbi:MAG: 2-vinyl bacteriochlorophyllide hydratase [Ardenticatenaceae bacterium]|nr:2-vinyl bacteriochlorophyllide hydratase [Ardenticatenaceae bacterium]MCB8948582.1 2-vinyl bacteriochlorophyllide hydratase [Ardenticatenaceae bacterium]